MADLKSVTSPIVETKYEDCTTYQGTREQLIDAGLAEDHQFPEGRRRIKYCEEEGWRMEYRAGGTFLLRRMQPIKQNNVLKLVKDLASQDTIDVLSALLEHAKRGEVIGVAFAAMYKQRKFIVMTTGQAHQDQFFTCGMLDVLSNKVKRGEC